MISLARLPRPLCQQCVECVLDGAHIGVLVGERLVVLVHQHRGIDLEHDEVTAAIEPAIDAEIVEPDAFADRVQCLIMRWHKHRARIFQERRFLLLHPEMLVHVGCVVMQLPIASDREMIGQDFLTDEDEAVFAEIAVT